MNTDICTKYPGVPQILWPQVFSFVFRRFDGYQKQKSSHDQWDETGKTLWKLFEQSKDEKQFIQEIEQLLTTAGQQRAVGNAPKAARP